ncbi:hypothetical protein KY320_04200 [Candidatus Woesearchaeota archaeon]|nr:hypothetical protein [Candidatus Woesearchaeota archaeon]
MKKALREMFLLGVGAAALTKKQADKVVNGLVKQGKLSKKEGEKLVSSIMKESESHRKQLKSTVEKHSKEFVKKFGPAARKELDKLSKHIAGLEKKASRGSSKKRTKKRKPSKKK